MMLLLLLLFNMLTTMPQCSSGRCAQSLRGTSPMSVRGHRSTKPPARSLWSLIWFSDFTLTNIITVGSFQAPKAIWKDGKGFDSNHSRPQKKIWPAQMRMDSSTSWQNHCRFPSSVLVFSWILCHGYQTYSLLSLLAMQSHETFIEYKSVLV